MPLDEALSALPDAPVRTEGGGFDLSDQEYADTVGQVLAEEIGRVLGLRLHRRAAPYQGLQRDIDLFGTVRRVGFYATFAALADADELATAYGPVRIARDATDGAVHAVRGPTFAGVQFHPESVLSQDGLVVLADLLALLLPAPADRVRSPAVGSGTGKRAPLANTSAQLG